MSGNKRYGLILSKQGVNGLKKPSVFDSDSDSTEDAPKDWMKSALQKQSAIDKPKRQARIEIEKALQEDPTVYQYDEIYEELEKSKQKPEEEKKRKERKPKYMEMLIKQAEKRKKENERRLEKQVQKEREAEGDEFADKEAFITASYKKKLEELKKLAEEEERMERLEAIGDVTKQKDMTGFYRHLYRSNVADQDDVAKIDSKEKIGNKVEVEIPNAKKRKYRKRESHSPTSDEASETESISENLVESGDVITKVEETQKVDKEETKEPLDDENKLPDTIKGTKSESVEISETPVKPKTSKHKDIWVKRTVGEVFDEAVKRYFIRISNKSE